MSGKKEDKIDVRKQGLMASISMWENMQKDKSKSTGNLSERRKSSLTSVFSFKNNPLKSKKDRKSTSILQTPDTPKQEARKISLQHEGLFSSGEKVETSDKVIITPHKFLEDLEESNGTTLDDEFAVKKQISHPHNNEVKIDKLPADNKTPDNINGPSGDKPELKHQNNVTSFDTFDNTTNKQTELEKFECSKESETPTTPTSPDSQVTLRNDSEMSVQYRSNRSRRSSKSKWIKSRPVISIIIDASSSEDEDNTEKDNNVKNSKGRENKSEDEKFNDDLQELFGGILDQVESMVRQISNDEDDDNQGQKTPPRGLTPISEVKSIDEEISNDCDPAKIRTSIEEAKVEKDHKCADPLGNVNKVLGMAKEESISDADKKGEKVDGEKEPPSVAEESSNANLDVKANPEDIAVCDESKINNQTIESEKKSSSTDDENKKVFSEFGEKIVLKSTQSQDHQVSLDDTAIKDDANVEPKKEATKSQVESVIDDIINILKENLSEDDLTKILDKIEPMLDEIKEEYNKEASKNVSSPSSNPVPAVSGPPPPAPPPPPPPPTGPPSNGLKIKVRTSGGSLTTVENNGEITGIEVRIKPKKGDDMMAQLRKRLNERTKRDSLATRLAKFDNK